MRAALENIPVIKDSLIKYGIVNKTLQNAILAVIGKESNYKPQTENLNYTAKRITEVWPYITLATAKTLEKNPAKLAAFVYGNKYGNQTPEDALNYIGRGFNQITFKDQYKKYGNLLNIDLINNPNLLNNTKIAADAAALYFKNTFAANKNTILKKYGIDINNITPGTDSNTLLKIAVNANAGFAKSETIVNNEYNKALQYFDYLQGNKTGFIPGLLPLLFLGAITLYILKNR
jgi:predicted chitinase